MTIRASGTFEVELTPQSQGGEATDAAVGRMSIDKRFRGDLEGTSKGEMLAFMTAVEGSAGYVAMEQVSGTLKSRSGTFVLQHSGTMTRGTPQLVVTVVPDSGTGQLTGLAGQMTILIADGKHSYELEYTIAETPCSSEPSAVPAQLPGATAPRVALTPALPPSWRLAVFSGRLGEISGHHACAALTLVFRLVLEAQRRGEPVAWIALRGSSFYPPDASEAGIDLAALAVVWAEAPNQSCRAADWLVRSGGFGLVVLDLGERSHMPIPVQSRLVGLAGRHDTALLCLTEKDDGRPSIGSLVGVRAEAMRVEKIGDRFRCEAHVLKDKRRGPGWRHTEICRGPDGLR